MLQESGVKQAEAGGVRQRAGALAEEIQSLDGRRDKIPRDHREMRRQICEHLHIGEAALPFAGELLDVPDGESTWRPSLEVLLHGFALSVLVPEEHYRRFSAFVDNSEFKRRLVYFQVPKGTGASISLDTTKACGKIVIKPDAWCRGWLQARLFEDFPHHCAETMEEFWQVRGPALTRIMDTATLTAHCALLSKAAPVENPAFETLSPEEKGAAIQVQDNKHGIEQEKLPPDFIHGILNSFLS